MSVRSIAVVAGFAMSLFGAILRAAPLPEQTVSIVKRGVIFDLTLEATLYKPEGDGPFPLALVNHGKELGDTRFQGRFRPNAAIRYFLERGYVVLLPMRQGFSKSGGMYNGGNCNVEANGVAQADDVRAAIAYAHSLPYVDPARSVIAGHSHGGWTTLAYGASDPHPSVRALVNFAGGLREVDCLGWEREIVRAAASYGGRTKLRTLWVYGENDSYFGPALAEAMFKGYQEGNRASTLASLSTFESDAHRLFLRRSGRAVWEPHLDRFLQSAGLPSDVVNPQYAFPPPLPVPPPTDFAPVSQETAVPYLGQSGREGYKTFLQKRSPKAFALNEDGRWGWNSGGDDPLRAALDNCERGSKRSCRLYAVDDNVVWTGR